MGTREGATVSNEKHTGPPKHLLKAGYKIATLSELDEAFYMCARPLVVTRAPPYSS